MKDPNPPGSGKDIAEGKGGAVHRPVPSYKPLPGAEDEIYRLIGDVTISMRAGDYLPMPELVTSLKLCYGIVDKIKFNRAPRSECPVRYFPKMSE